MIAVSFTGTADSRFKKAAKLIVPEAVAGLKGSPDQFYSGAAEVVDVLAAEAAMESFPKALHVVAIPYWEGDGVPLPCPYDVTSVKALLEAGAKAVHCRPGRTKAEGYMIRNDYLVKRGTHLLAFPRTEKEEQRSGTWATVRRARKAKLPVKIVALG